MLEQGPDAGDGVELAAEPGEELIVEPHVEGRAIDDGSTGLDRRHHRVETAAEIDVDGLIDRGRHSVLGEEAGAQVHRDDLAVDEDSVVIEDDKVEGSG